jgi:hypothetical protein
VALNLSIRVEKPYETYAWVAFFGMGILALVFAFWYLLTGTFLFPNAYENVAGISRSKLIASDPGAATLVTYVFRSIAAFFGLLAGSFTVAISLKSYRKGERWAWYTFWMVPITLGYLATVDATYALAAVYVLDIPLVALSLLGLLLPFRKFFPPNKQRQSSASSSSLQQQA